MFKRSVFAASVLTAWVLVAGAQAAHADWFTLGGSFRIGPIRFSLVLGDPLHRGHQSYYYRTLRPLEYSGYRCNDRCLRQDSYTYHHQSCPLIHRHLSVHRVDHEEVVGRYGVYDVPNDTDYDDNYDYRGGGWRSERRHEGYYNDGYYGGYPEEGGHRRRSSRHRQHRDHPGHSQCPRVH
jgi:hypothetical protein